MAAPAEELATRPQLATTESFLQKPFRSEDTSATSALLSDRNLFIFHLPLEWSEDELCQQFGKFGLILSSKVVRRLDGVSKGYGFVCYSNAASAQNAITAMDGFLMPGGKKLSVALKRKREDCPNTTVDRLLSMHNQNKPFDRDRHCTVFVFHLPSTWTETDLRNSFSPHGEMVSCKVLLKPDGTSKGFGFITYSNPKEAAQAIQNMDGFSAGGKRLKVELKDNHVRQEVQPGGTIYIANLPETWTIQDLKRHFQHCGTIVQSAVMMDSETKTRSLGVGFVTFQTPAEAIQAIAGMNGFCVGEKKLRVSIKRGEEGRFYNNMVVADPYQQAFGYPAQRVSNKRPNSVPAETANEKYFRGVSEAQQYMNPFLAQYAAAASMMPTAASPTGLPVMLMNNPQYLSQLQAMYPNSVPVAPYQATGTSLDLWGMSNYGTLNNSAGAATATVNTLQPQSTPLKSNPSQFLPVSNLNPYQVLLKMQDQPNGNSASTQQTPFNCGAASELQKFNNCISPEWTNNILTFDQ